LQQPPGTKRLREEDGEEEQEEGEEGRQKQRERPRQRRYRSQPLQQQWEYPAGEIIIDLTGDDDDVCDTRILYL
jgi:hypothetical protein